MAIFTAITTAGSLLLEGFGLIKQAGETKQARSDIAEQTALDRKMQKKTFDLGVREIRSAERERERTWKFREEERNWGRSREFADRFVSLMDREPENSRRITEVWRNAGQGR